MFKFSFDKTRSLTYGIILVVILAASLYLFATKGAFSDNQEMIEAPAGFVIATPQEIALSSTQPVFWAGREGFAENYLRMSAKPKTSFQSNQLSIFEYGTFEGQGAFTIFTLGTQKSRKNIQDFIECKKVDCTGWQLKETPIGPARMMQVGNTVEMKILTDKNSVYVVSNIDVNLEDVIAQLASVPK